MYSFYVCLNIANFKAVIDLVCPEIFGFSPGGGGTGLIVLYTCATRETLEKHFFKLHMHKSQLGVKMYLLFRIKGFFWVLFRDV